MKLNDALLSPRSLFPPPPTRVLQHGIAPVSTSTAGRPKLTSSSLEALRVRVVKRGDDKDGGRSDEKNGDNDDESDDSFEVDLKLEVRYAWRKRSSAASLNILQKHTRVQKKSERLCPAVARARKE